MMSPRFPNWLLCASIVALGGCSAAGPGSLDEDATRRGDALDGQRTTLWIHGRNASGSTSEGDYDDFSYWGAPDQPAGVHKRAVNWDGRSHIAESNGAIRRALDCFCTGPNVCYLAGHSAGDAQIGYALDLYGQSQRQVKDGIPNSTGECGSTGETQTGWNILWVEVAGGAAGGTELADLGYWAVSDPLTGDLRTSRARTLYDHNNTQGVAYYMVVGAKGTLYASVLPGQDDEVIAYHSAGGLSETGRYCNPHDWFCDSPLGMNGDPSRKSGHTVAKWANHSVAFRDDGEQYDHYARNAWAGVVSPAAADLAEYAQ